MPPKKKAASPKGAKPKAAPKKAAKAEKAASAEAPPPQKDAAVKKEPSVKNVAVTKQASQKAPGKGKADEHEKPLPPEPPQEYDFASYVPPVLQSARKAAAYDLKDGDGKPHADRQVLEPQPASLAEGIVIAKRRPSSAKPFLNPGRRDLSWGKDKAGGPAAEVRRNSVQSEGSVASSIGARPSFARAQLTGALLPPNFSRSPGHTDAVGHYFHRGLCAVTKEGTSCALPVPGPNGTMVKARYEKGNPKHMQWMANDGEQRYALEVDSRKQIMGERTASEPSMPS